MKYRFLTITLICISLSLVLLQIVGSGEASNSTKLELELVPSNSSFKVGEVVYFDVKLTNNGNQDVSFLNAVSEKAGYLHILVSRNGNNFQEYRGAGWGFDDTYYGNFNLKPMESIEHSLSVLGNQKPNSPNSITADVIKRASEGKILTDYAFPEAGIYYVKATYSVRTTIQAKSILIESEPIQITITEPIGEDLEVWNKIKDDGNFAYFIQEGDIHIPSYKTDEREKFLDKVEQIINQYPNSFYAESLRQSLTKFRADEAERQEFLQKLKPKQPQ